MEAGEQINYLPRREASTLLLPGNDFYVFDGELVLFLHYQGSGIAAGFSVTDDPAAVKICTDTFESVWKLSTPAREYLSQ